MKEGCNHIVYKYFLADWLESQFEILRTSLSKVVKMWYKVDVSKILCVRKPHFFQNEEGL